VTAGILGIWLALRTQVQRERLATLQGSKARDI
jgi:hypothetical protein